ncbi:hypothetical protein DFP72DRAFT_173446 [Ephemerocybe angulata]|uniref:DUF6533 domain-containing protein n=1 Tax=Ephemerocybe angulata TaxID=980116 RepID=A0A8H6MA37_9AGAR|nr:hypothetical protein DFP72DRAFT_173446 [Tulosesus angulatus]
MTVDAGTKSPSAQAAALIEAIRANRIVNYAAIGSSLVLCVDFLENLQREVEHMWSEGISIPKVLFFLLRYYSFVHTIISVIYHGNTHYAGEACTAPFLRDAYSSLTVHTICEAISYVRVFAFAGRSTILLPILTVSFVGTTSLQYYFLTKFTKTVKFANLPASALLGCIPVAGENMWLSIVFILILFSLVLTTGIMIFIAYRRRANTHGIGGLLRLFYRDGIFYFLTLSTLAVTNIIFDHTAPSNL